MPKRISKQGPGRPPIGETAMTGAEREAKRKRAMLERLHTASAAADAAASALRGEADALEEAVGRPLAAEAASRLREAIEASQDAYTAALAAVGHPRRHVERGNPSPEVIAQRRAKMAAAAAKTGEALAEMERLLREKGEAPSSRTRTPEAGPGDRAASVRGGA